MSTILQKAREYEQKYRVYITPEERPGYHLTPQVGWMNDPNGFSFYGGEYHLFYQYHPYSTAWGPMHWGHAVSTDLLRWKYLPAAIAPDTEIDQVGCFSGSAIGLPDGRQLLMYTGVRQSRNEDGTRRDQQTQCLAVGNGLNYVKHADNPVLDDKDLPEGFTTADFRDPKLWREEDGSYACVVGARTEDGSGAILLFTSPDGFRWKYETILDRSYNEYGRMWECPDFFPLDGKQLLITSPQDMSPLGLEFHNGNNTMALIGSYDRNTHRFEREQVQAIDYGLEFYAPQTMLTPDGRRVMIGWLQNWDTCSAQPPNAKWFGQTSTPRELSLKDGRLIQVPVREIAALHGRRVAYQDVTVQEEVSLKGVYGRMVDMTVTLRPADVDGFQQFTIKVAKGSQHYTNITFFPKASVLRVNRAHSGLARDIIHERDCLVRQQNGEIKLRILLDRFSLEIFVNDGEQALSTAIYTPQTADGISFEADRSVIMSVEKFDMIAE